MNPEDFDELIGAFIAESQEFLQSMEANLLSMEKCTHEQRLQAVKELFRAAHSIKGSALMFGFRGLSKAAHYLEDGFAILRDRADLAQINHSTITMLLEGVDNLKNITQRVCQGGSEDEGEIEAIAEIKTNLEIQYGKEEVAPPAINNPINNPAIKAIFEHDLPQIFNRLETELSQVKTETIPETVANINQVYYQLSGLAGMLQLPEFGQIAEKLRVLIDTQQLTIEQLQLSGWEIAQNLQTARNQILQGQPITVINKEPVISNGALIVVAEEEPEKFLITDQDKPKSIDKLNISNIEEVVVTNAQTSANTTSWQRPSIRVDLERITELVNLVGELVINRTNLEVQEAQLRSETKRIRKSILELNQFGSQLREEYDRLSTVNGAKLPIAVPSLPKVPVHHESSTINHQPKKFDLLELDQYSEFHLTAQSVIEVSQAISQSGSKIEELTVKFERSTDQLRRITDQLRTRVMQLRVVPFSRAVDHLPRALRELCRTYNKEVNLLLLGRDTQIDESLLDALRDPLVHLVRNAFDHGIETPEARIAAGKPPSGQIEIEARHQGGQTIISITDDGKGIDPEIIRKRVVEASLLTVEQANELSIAELYEFLFWPGFSTAGKVTDLSGRGVGLDIVRTNLRQVRGTVKVDSRPGRGTNFILKLPLILSITEALLVRVDRNTIAVPLDAIEELLNIQGTQIHMAGKQPMLLWREEFIRLVRLQELLHFSIAHPDGPSPDPLLQDYIPVIVLASSEGVLAIAVERIIGQQEIVVKPLPPPIAKPRGIVGSTILGDGRVVTILDVDDLIGQFYAQSGTTISVDEKRPHLMALPSSSQPQILVVDDSYTIRQLLSLTLTKARYRVVQAKDGQDALTQLQEGLNCDLIIADIEMPRMDGFELLKSVKAQPKLATIPVAMLTSRSGAKHRQMATDLGAVQYFTKPYSETQLLEAIAKLIHT